MANTDFLKTAVYINKDYYTEGDNIEDGKLRMDSVEFDKMFLNPYKELLINNVSRLSDNSRGKVYMDNKNVSVVEDFARLDSIRFFIEMNLKDLLLSTSLSLIDDLAGGFIYTDTQYQNHYEFEFPLNMITKPETDPVDFIYKEGSIGGTAIKICFDYLSTKGFSEEDEIKNDITVETIVSLMFDNIYAISIRTFFNELITKITAYYISKPEMVKDFYISFLSDNETYVPPSKNGYNNTYNFISIALREMIAPHLEKFKDGLIVMGNTVSSMIIGYKDYMCDNDYMSYLTYNPFALELYKEKYGIKDDEEEDE